MLTTIEDNPTTTQQVTDNPTHLQVDDNEGTGQRQARVKNPRHVKRVLAIGMLFFLFIQLNHANYDFSYYLTATSLRCRNDCHGRHLDGTHH